jgi:hypothetical protein
MLAWWPHTTDPGVASFRLRCLQIVESLRQRGVDARIHAPGDPAPEVLVLSKRYDAASLQAAQALARTHGTRIVLDLCDNHFHHDSGAPESLVRRADTLRQAVAAVDLVTVSSEALGEVVRAECPGAAPLRLVEDAAEKPADPTGPARWKHWRAEWALHGLKRALAGIPLERRLVWFGNHGSPGVQAGLVDLERPRPWLEAEAARGGPLSLTVISNHRERAAQFTRGWAIPTPYLEWTASTFSRALRLHSATLIPITPNPFTTCKTANRVLSAFEHGLNVIGDSIPSYTPFAGCAVLDDWAQGLGPYLGQAARRQADVQRGRQIADARYSLANITDQWSTALRDIPPRPPSPSTP